ncbi:MAG: hypothetical protein RL243_320, partial [Actinomycetota bacterium]
RQPEWQALPAWRLPTEYSLQSHSKVNPVENSLAILGFTPSV